MTYSMYQENILDHSRHPRNFGVLDNASFHAQAVNPLCGDEIEFFLRYDEHEAVQQAMFTGRGCAITVAAASLLTEKVRGMKRAEVAALRPEDVVELLHVPIAATRMQCATLSLDALHKTQESAK